METCLWCTEAAKSQEAVTVFLKDYCTGGLTKKEMQDANNDFIYCSDCVVEYHQAREKVPSLHKVQTHCEPNGCPCSAPCTVYTLTKCGGSHNKCANGRLASPAETNEDDRKIVAYGPISIAYTVESKIGELD